VKEFPFKIGIDLSGEIKVRILHFFGGRDFQFFFLCFSSLKLLSKLLILVIKQREFIRRLAFVSIFFRNKRYVDAHFF